MPHRSHVYEPPSERERAAPELAPLAFDRAGVRAIDRAATEEYGIPGLVLMENAALALCREALDMLELGSTALRAVDPARRAEQARESTQPPRVVIVCGAGNNGGDGYALARHLHNRGVDVLIAPLGEPKPDSDAGVNRRICKRMGLHECASPLSVPELERELRAADLIVDAIFGTGLDRPVEGGEGGAAEVINAINCCDTPVLAVDLPSGMDCDTGRVLGCCVRATRTVTFVGPKLGFAGLDAQELLGELVVAGIGAPVELLERFGRRPSVPHPEPPEHRIETPQRVPHPGR